MAAIVVGFLQIWAHRHDMNPDGVSYLDMASLHAGWRGLVNGYWSPLYPLLLKAAFFVFHPDSTWESTLVHVVNFAIYLASLAGFEMFVAELIRLRSVPRASPSEWKKVPAWILTAWGYLFFIWAGQFWLRPALVTPDLCVAAASYVGIAILIRIRLSGANWLHFALLGAVLGGAYLSKAAMFPLACVFLFCSYFAAGRGRHVFLRTVIGIVTFSMISAPLVIALSMAKHRLTFGDSGTINYAEYVNGTGGIHWQGGPAGSGVPIHPTRQLLADPPLYEFAEPVPGSYPPTYDLSYWSDGVRPRFHLKEQLRTLLRSANLLLQMFSRSGVLYVVFVVLILLLRRSGRWSSEEGRAWTIWLPSYAAFGMYALVHVEPRFVGEFALMLLMSILANVRIPSATAKMWLPRVALIIMIAPGLAIVWTAAGDCTSSIAPKPFQQLELARGVQSAGIQRGERIGVIGGEPGAYWARLAGVRIIAEIPKSAERRFWTASSVTRSKALNQFSQAGVQAVVAVSTPAPDAEHGWELIPGTGYYLRRLPSHVE
jgi:hypothetical protein